MNFNKIFCFAMIFLFGYCVCFAEKKLETINQKKAYLALKRMLFVDKGLRRVSCRNFRIKKIENELNEYLKEQSRFLIFGKRRLFIELSENQFSRFLKSYQKKHSKNCQRLKNISKNGRIIKVATNECELAQIILVNIFGITFERFRELFCDEYDIEAEEETE